MRVLFQAGLLTKIMNNNVSKIVDNISADLLKEVIRRSPVRTGKFKRSWRKRGSGLNYQISNSQSYGHELEHGKSGQAPEGVVGPSIQTIKQRRYGR